MLTRLRMWMVLANLPKTQAEAQNRILELEARLKTRGQRPEPDIPDSDSLPNPTAIQTVRACSSWVACCLGARHSLLSQKLNRKPLLSP